MNFNCKLRFLQNFLGWGILLLLPPYKMHPLTAQYVHQANRANHKVVVNIKLKIRNLMIFSGQGKLVITSPLE